MVVTRLIHASALLTIAAAIAVVGCGGESGSATAGSSGQEKTLPSIPAEPPPQSILNVTTVPGLGKVLADASYRTVYYFTGDKRGNGKSSCHDACARKWWYKRGNRNAPIAPGAEIDKSLIGVIRRPEGQGYLQQTYNGWPLYTNVEESSEEAKGAGETEFGGTWYALHPDGTRAGG